MKIFFATNVRLPSEKAHGIQILKTCEALALRGHTVTLFVPKRKNSISVDPFEYYRVQKNFTIEYLPTLNILWLKSLGFWLQTILFSEMVAYKIYSQKPDAVISRDAWLLINLLCIHPNLVWEAHRGEVHLGIAMLLKKVKLITISHGLLNVYKKFVTDPTRAVVVPDAVTVSAFQVADSKEVCRKRLGLPMDKKIAVYTGHLYEWKGAHVFADASRDFQKDELAVFVGGTESDIKSFSEKNKDNDHLVIMGHKPYHEIPYYLKAADMVVLPNSGKEAISRLYTSPMKLFEYMASGTPIVASDLPSIREILKPDMAIFVPSDSPSELLRGIRIIFNDPQKGVDLAGKAMSAAVNFSWENRAKAIESIL